MMKFDRATDDRPIWPRNVWASGPRPLSNPHYGAAEIQPNTEVPTQWTPYGTLNAVPYLKEMPGSMMAVAQAEMYDASPNPWPNNGQYDKPVDHFTDLMRLQTHTSAHMGESLATGPAPTMYFHAPPVFSMQTKPIPAVGV